jgi:hypothetical protein
VQAAGNGPAERRSRAAKEVDVMRTMVMAIGAAAALALPAGAAASSAGFLGGLTSQHEPVVVKLAPNGRRVVTTHIALVLRCRSGEEFDFTDQFDDLPVSKSGRFGAHLDTGTVKNGPDDTVRVRAAVNGRMRHAGQEVSGTWKLMLTGTTDQQSVSCPSGRVHFDIRR